MMGISDNVNNPVAADKEKVEAFLQHGANFFSTNSGRNIPNILNSLFESIQNLQKSTESLNSTIERSGASSQRLAEALNRLTLAGVIVGGFNVLAVLAPFIVKVIWHS